MARPGSLTNPHYAYLFPAPLLELVKAKTCELGIRSPRFFLQAAILYELSCRWLDQDTEPLPAEYAAPGNPLVLFPQRLRAPILAAGRRRAARLGLSFAEYVRRVAYHTAMAGLLDGEEIVNGVVLIGGDRWQARQGRPI